MSGEPCLAAAAAIAAELLGLPRPGGAVAECLVLLMRADVVGPACPLVVRIAAFLKANSVGALTMRWAVGKDPSEGDGDSARPGSRLSARRPVKPHIRVDRCGGAAGETRPVPGDGDRLSRLGPALGLLARVFSDWTRAKPPSTTFAADVFTLEPTGSNFWRLAVPGPLRPSGDRADAMPAVLPKATEVRARGRPVARLCPEASSRLRWAGEGERLSCEASPEDSATVAVAARALPPKVPGLVGALVTPCKVLLDRLNGDAVTLAEACRPNTLDVAEAAPLVVRPGAVEGAAQAC